MRSVRREHLSPMAMAAVLVFIIAAFFKAATDSLGADADLERDRLVKEAQQAQVGKDPLQVEEGAPCVDFGRHTKDIPKVAPFDQFCMERRHPTDKAGPPRDPFPEGDEKGRKSFKAAFDALVGRLSKIAASGPERGTPYKKRCAARGNSLLLADNRPNENIELMTFQNVANGGHWADHACLRLDNKDRDRPMQVALTTYRAYWVFRWNTKGERTKQIHRQYARFEANRDGLLTSVEGWDDGNGRLFQIVNRTYPFGGSEKVYSLNDGSSLWASKWHQLLSAWVEAP